MSDVGYKPQKKAVKTVDARGGVTGHNVRYVLMFGMAGAVVAFLLVAFWSHL
jgi:hypothetical protein